MLLPPHTVRSLQGTLRSSKDPEVERAFSEVKQFATHSEMTSPAILIVGPTAVGKTAISLGLAERYEGEIVIADSLQVYRHMDIGTAKPTAEEREEVPHHLLDIADPDQPFTAADYSRLAEEKVREIRQRGHTPFLVGGCGLYIRAWADSLFPGPSESPKIRRRLRQLASQGGGKGLHQRLFMLDPASADKIHPNDTYRILRALEIFEASGKRPSEIRGAQWARRSNGPFLLLGLSRPRASLYRRIEERIDSMIKEGFLEEVEFLMGRFSVDCKPFQGLGYKHMIEYLQGRCEFEEAVSRWKRDTRRYAKRQITWFSRDDRVHWISLDEDREEAWVRIQSLIEANLP